MTPGTTKNRLLQLSLQQPSSHNLTSCKNYRNNYNSPLRASKNCTLQKILNFMKETQEELGSFSGRQRTVNLITTHTQNWLNWSKWSRLWRSYDNCRIFQHLFQLNRPSNSNLVNSTTLEPDDFIPHNTYFPLLILAPFHLQKSTIPYIVWAQK